MSASDDLFRVIVDPTRRAILESLGEQPLTVNELCGQFQLTQGAVSQHLKVLRDAGLVNVAQAGRHRLYSMNPAPLLELIHWLNHFSHFWPGKLDSLESYLQERHGDDVDET